MPLFQWHSPAERSEVRAMRDLRAASRRRLCGGRGGRAAGGAAILAGVYGTGVHGGGGGDDGKARGRSGYDAFEQADTWANRKRRRRGEDEWPLRELGVGKAGLPTELWIAVSDGEESRKFANLDAEKAGKKRAKRRRAVLDADDEAEGKARGEGDEDDEDRDDEDHDGIEELKDDDFDEDDDDAGNDYNAEKYFDDGEGGDDDHGGDDGGDDY